jgi:hypothetical protein
MLAGFKTLLAGRTAARAASQQITTLQKQRDDLEMQLKEQQVKASQGQRSNVDTMHDQFSKLISAMFQTFGGAAAGRSVAASATGGGSTVEDPQKEVETITQRVKARLTSATEAPMTAEELFAAYQPLTSKMLDHSLSVAASVARQQHAAGHDTIAMQQQLHAQTMLDQMRQDLLQHSSRMQAVGITSSAPAAAATPAMPAGRAIAASALNTPAPGPAFSRSAAKPAMEPDPFTAQYLRSRPSNPDDGAQLYADLINPNPTRK